MSPWGWVRLGLLAYRKRGLLTRILIWSVVAVIAMPAAMIMVVVAAVARPASAPAPAGVPMSAWVVTQEFGCTGLALEPALGACPHFHSGIDLAAPAGTLVHAVLAGTSEVIYSRYGFGTHVVLHHAGDLVTIYGHLAQALVQTGDVVAAGAVIGYEGSSGNSTGPHLHFEVRLHGAAVPPRQVFETIFNPIGVAGQVHDEPPPVRQRSGRTLQ
jgi:murein DD-endopeptidase MepM/ murein hydrolase activator NlpD